MRTIHPVPRPMYYYSITCDGIPQDDKSIVIACDATIELNIILIFVVANRRKRDFSRDRYFRM